MVKRAADGMVIRYGDAGARLEGKELTKYMSQLNDYLGHFDKVSKKLRNEDVVQAFAEIFANEGKDSVRRTDFESPDKLKKMRARLNELAKPYQFKAVSDVELDEEHQHVLRHLHRRAGRDAHASTGRSPPHRSRASFSPSRHSSAKRSTAPSSSSTPARKPSLPRRPPKSRPNRISRTPKRLSSKAQSTSAPLPARRRNLRSATRKSRRIPSRRRSPREVFEYVIEQGRKEYSVQRYKGLGEMTAPQLWETTMDPARRTLLQVKLEDIAATEEIFTTLMGEDVEARRKFIEENALDVKNLDI